MPNRREFLTNVAAAGLAGRAWPSPLFAAEPNRLPTRTITRGPKHHFLTLDEIAQTGTIPNHQSGIKHYFNHLLFNPDGSRFIALHRWRDHRESTPIHDFRGMADRSASTRRIGIRGANCT